MAQIAQSWRIEIMRAHPRLSTSCRTSRRTLSATRRATKAGRTRWSGYAAASKMPYGTARPSSLFASSRSLGSCVLAGKAKETRALIEEALALAKARSSCTCELCGAEGDKYHVSDNVMFRCGRHAGGPAYLGDADQQAPPHRARGPNRAARLHTAPL